MIYEKELQKTTQKKFRVEKVIKRKDDKLYVKWKGDDSSFNSWIYKKGSINEWMFPRTKIFRRKSESWNSLPNYATKADLKNAAGVDTKICSKGWFNKPKI